MQFKTTQLNETFKHCLKQVYFECVFYTECLIKIAAKKEKRT